MLFRAADIRCTYMKIPCFTDDGESRGFCLFQCLFELRHEGGTLVLGQMREVHGEQCFEGSQCLCPHGGSSCAQAALVVAIGE